MDIHSKGEYPSNMLSNFAPHEFEIDGIKCSGMEGFLQSLKYRNTTKQKAICALSGKEAKAAGSKKWIWKWTHNVWWRGKKMKRTSDEFAKLIDRAYMELSKNTNFAKALIHTGDEKLTHSIGSHDPHKTILTEEEFVSQLMKVRDYLKECIMKNKIISFDKEYDYLSNFYPAPVIVDGLRYLNSESAYQAAKCANFADRHQYTEQQPNVSKHMARNIPIREDWNQVKIPEMKKIVRAKFTQNPHLARYLLDTGDAELYEGNTWHDWFWGVDIKTLEGANHLGHILMELREDFRINGLPSMDGQLPWKQEYSHDGICVQFRDLTQIACDALVHASNEDLYGNDGLDYAVHRAAGPELRAACSELGGCSVSEAKITSGFRLNAKNVIHTVGPRYGQENDADILLLTYKNILDLAAENDLHTIAFPAISVGKFSYPKKEATAIAVEAVRLWMRENPAYELKVIFACVDQNVYQGFCEAVHGENS